MNARTVGLFGTAAILVACGSTPGEATGSAEGASVADTNQITQRPDGFFDVACKDGRKLTGLTQAQVYSPDLCKSTPPPPPPDIFDPALCQGSPMTDADARARAQFDVDNGKVDYSLGKTQHALRVKTCDYSASGPIECGAWGPSSDQPGLGFYAGYQYGAYAYDWYSSSLDALASLLDTDLTLQLRNNAVYLHASGTTKVSGDWSAAWADYSFSSGSWPSDGERGTSFLHTNQYVTPNYAAYSGSLYAKNGYTSDSGFNLHNMVVNQSCLRWSDTQNVLMSDQFSNYYYRVYEMVVLAQY